MKSEYGAILYYVSIILVSLMITSLYDNKENILVKVLIAKAFILVGSALIYRVIYKQYYILRT